MKRMKCPICKTEDYLRFVFIDHYKDGAICGTENPSDLHFIYVCENFHAFNENGDIRQIGEDTI